MTLSVCLLSVLNTQAQNEFYITFRGTCYRTNETGEIFSTPITEKTILRDILAKVGITDQTGYALVYHIGGTSWGDTIDVVNPNTGVAYDNLFGFYYGEAFGRMGITNATSTTIKRVDYIYTKQNPIGASMGAALVTKTSVKDKKGNLRISYQGQMQWIVTADAKNDTQVCVGTFKTGRGLPF